MKIKFTIFIICLFTSFTFAQTYKWPYVNYYIPPHLNVSFGYQGFNSKAYFVGLALSPYEIYNTGRGACAGPRIYYKQFDAGKRYRSYEAELAIYSAITFGINYNYNTSPGNRFSGFKPFIGICLYHLSINYGYNFFDDKKNPGNIYRHNVFHITLDIPVCKLTKRNASLK